MARFGYTALDGSRRMRGSIDAPSATQAKQLLRDQGLLITQLKKRRGSGAPLKGDALVNFTLQLAQLVRSGMPIFESLSALEEQYRGTSHHGVLASLCESIRSGKRLSEALEGFDPLYRALVASGEATGTLDDVLEKLAHLLAKQEKLRKSLITAMIYPSVIATFCVAVVILLLTFAIPSMAPLFEGRQLNPFTRFVLGSSHFLTTAWPIYLPLTVAKVGLGALFLPKFKQLTMRLPPIRKVLVQAALARFCRTLATLQHGGLNMIESLQLARRTMRLPPLERAIERAENRLVMGHALSETLKNEPLLPPLFCRMLAVGEEGGELGPMLERMATLYEEELEKMLSRLAALAQPLILVVMGAIVGLIMLAVLLPLTDMQF
jgi:general secretion pathway protein F